VPDINRGLREGEKVRAGVGSGKAGKEDGWPTDCPVGIEVERVTDTKTPPKHPRVREFVLLGHILRLKFFSKGKGRKGINVEIKMYRSPNALVINVDGAEVYRWEERKKS
jgi:hypothetical protein